ncbi:MAG: SAM-dependent chlorinase/fluorinase [Bacteroidia bacterium]|nr:SAM-dependent chlorinase/fluorinase [Bacteroidia bacterium]
MSVLTFLSDFGADSHYMASFRGGMHRSNIDLPFIEISSRIEPFDIVEASYLCSMVYQDFPAGSIHILATNVVATSFDGHLAAEYNGHFFIAPDNGILSLIFGEKFAGYFRIPTNGIEQKIQNIYIPFLQKLIESKDLPSIASKAEKIVVKTRLVPTNDGSELRGTVLFVDHFGNAYTNISKTDFDLFLNGGRCEIELSRHTTIDSVSENFADVQVGDSLCYFSEHGYLVVAIKQSNAMRLLNLRKSKPVIIKKR